MKQNPAPKGIRSILLIEDEDAVAQGMTELLVRHGFSVIRARDGTEGIKVPFDRPIDLVITDIFMDRMDGLETVIQVKKRFPAIPIIAVSGGSRKVGVDCLHMAQVLGADRILRKPIFIAVLLDTIRELECNHRWPSDGDC